MTDALHTPVLMTDVCEMAKGLAHAPNYYLDGTFGRGGHALAILECFPNLKVVALDQDLEAIEYGQSEFSSAVSDGQMIFVHDNFSDWPSTSAKIEDKWGDVRFDLILLDLGVSSPQLDQSERGFSFYKDGPLDMRMDQRRELSAKEIINNWSADELKELFREYGEVRKPGRAVDFIIEARTKKPFSTTLELSQIIEKAEGWQRRGHHPATNYFLALRLRVNNELDQLNEAIPTLVEQLTEGGRLMVITFHSLEDRIMKYIFKDLVAQGMGRLVNKKVIQPVWDEKKKNPRARSAKLRGFERETGHE